MFTHRTNVLLQPEEHRVLTHLAKKFKTSKGGVIRQALRKSFSKDFQTQSAGEKILDKIIARKNKTLRKSSTSELNQLISHGRKY